jgi:hypothetical protein
VFTLMFLDALGEHQIRAWWIANGRGAAFGSLWLMTGLALNVGSVQCRNLSGVGGGADETAKATLISHYGHLPADRPCRVMRKDDDYRANHQLKAELLDQIQLNGCTPSWPLRTSASRCRYPTRTSRRAADTCQRRSPRPMTAHQPALAGASIRRLASLLRSPPRRLYLPRTAILLGRNQHRSSAGSPDGVILSYGHASVGRSAGCAEVRECPVPRRRRAGARPRSSSSVPFSKSERSFPISMVAPGGPLHSFVAWSPQRERGSAAQAQCPIGGAVGLQHRGWR